MKNLRILLCAAGALLLLPLLLHDLDVVIPWLIGIVDSTTRAHSPTLRYVVGAIGFLSLSSIPAIFLWQQITGHGRGRIFTALIAFEVLGLILIWSLPKPSSRFCTSCDYVVGGVDLSKQTTPDKLIKEFGAGCSVKVEGWPETRSYYFPKAGITMLISDRHIKISRAVSHSPACKAIRELDTYGTSSGVNLGATEQKIIEVYGQPTERDSVTPANPQLIYRMPGKAMVFHLSDNNVESIEVETTPSAQ